MQEVLAQVFTYVWGVWRHRWLALAVAWLVAIAGWIWVWQLPENKDKMSMALMSLVVFICRKSLTMIVTKIVKVRGKKQELVYLIGNRL